MGEEKRGGEQWDWWQAEKGENGVKSKGNNPFGEARPSEDVFKEKEQDWKEIEEKLETTKIKEVGTGSPDS
ncbi:eukaryotic translation initiation factor 4B3-like [Olea europaea subsp. europaea]|uniref:Eukaryotic translation initiation factor 4B3-like n=1 Tax=Olea europaea subsp. europaea TaxID=158383 RepID=A0A8S0TRX7_OLEEU|nr:eukaryotic translation initiation factor 4B3-like [Olea europaea subsp. europaea]